MISRLFLIPIVLSLLWCLYLTMNGYRIEQGKKGFIGIFIFSTLILGFFSLMIWLTD